MFANPTNEPPEELFEGEEEAQLIITEQPEKFNRYRSKTEGNSHGPLKGDTHQQKPSVKLLVAPQYAKTEFTILCQLYEPPSVGSTAELKLSPHSIKVCRQRPVTEESQVDNEKARKKNTSKKKATKTTSSSPYAELIYQTMKRVPNNNCELYFTLDNHFIQNPKKTDYQTELVKKYQYQKKWEDGRPELEKLNDAERLEIENKVAAGVNKSTQNQVCLGFEVYVREAGEPNKYVRFSGPLLSRPILNASPLRINKLHDTEGSVDGGNLVICLLSVAPINLQVSVNRIVDSTTVWSRQIEELTLYTQNKTISFRMPKYDGPPPFDDDNDDIKCFIQVIRTVDNCESPFEEYTYKSAEPNAKRRRTQTTERDVEHTKNVRLVADSMAELKISPEDKNSPPPPPTKKQLTIKCALEAIQTIGQQRTKAKEVVFEQIRSINDDYAEQQKDGNGLFHGVVDSGDFLKLYKMSKFLQFEELICDVVNIRRENLLHYACKLNKSTYIRPLIGAGCSIAAQDSSGNTPLHCALLATHVACIEKFCELMQNTMGFPAKTITELRQLFSVQNRQGQTVLHLAVLCDQRKLVEDMLKFCKTADINDACAVRELGSGKTILHLAASNDLQDMMTLIGDIVPQLRLK